MDRLKVNPYVCLVVIVVVVVFFFLSWYLFMLLLFSFFFLCFLFMLLLPQRNWDSIFPLSMRKNISNDCGHTKCLKLSHTCPTPLARSVCIELDRAFIFFFRTENYLTRVSARTTTTLVYLICPYASPCSRLRDVCSMPASSAAVTRSAR